MSPGALQGEVSLHGVIFMPGFFLGGVLPCCDVVLIV
jgi:hypothetical protein